MKKLIFIIILIVIGGCSDISTLTYIKNPSYEGSIRDIPIWLDIRFSKIEGIKIEEGIREWNTSLNGAIVMEIVDDRFNMEDWKIKEMLSQDGFMILKINHKNPIVNDDEGMHTLAFVNRIGGNLMYLIYDRLSEDMIKYIVLHEVGHLLGLGHDGNYLMSRSYNKERFECVDDETMKRVAEIWKLDLGRLNYCRR